MTESPDIALKRVEARIAGAKAAKEVFELLSWPNGYGADYADRFIETIRAMMPTRATDAHPKPEHQPIARLGKTTMPFGAHKDKILDDIPIEYLDWLCRSQEEFYRELRAYIKHPELESRRRGTESPC